MSEDADRRTCTCRGLTSYAPNHHPNCPSVTEEERADLVRRLVSDGTPALAAIGRRMEQSVPHGYAHNQSHLPPVEHAHEKEQASLSKRIQDQVWHFATMLDDLSPSGITGLAVVLPGPLYDLVTAGLVSGEAGFVEHKVAVGSGFVTIRRAEGA